MIEIDDIPDDYLLILVDIMHAGQPNGNVVKDKTIKILEQKGYHCYNPSDTIQLYFINNNDATKYRFYYTYESLKSFQDILTHDLIRYATLTQHVITKYCGKPNIVLSFDNKELYDYEELNMLFTFKKLLPRIQNPDITMIKIYIMSIRQNCTKHAVKDVC